jgi:hypothetical protein
MRRKRPVVAQIQGASVLGRVATGPRAGQRVLRLGRDPTAPVVTTGGPRHAHIEGFDLHANTAVSAGANARLENLCRYILRPPVPQEALELTPDGKVLLRLSRPWRDGTRALCFEPSEFLEKLAAIVPRPRANLLLYHGAFAPRGCCHSGPVIVEEVPSRIPKARSGSPGTAPARSAEAPPAAYVRPSYFPWADLLRRVFPLDTACGLLGAVGYNARASRVDRAAVVARETILEHLGLPPKPPCPSPARTPAWLRSRCYSAKRCVARVTITTPAATGPTDRTTAGTPLRAQRQHWRCRALPAGGLRTGPTVGFARLTGKTSPHYEVWRGGKSKRGPPALCRGGSDTECSVSNPSLYGTIRRRSWPHGLRATQA